LVITSWGAIQEGGGIVFERRLSIVLGLMATVAAVLVGRVFQVQVISHRDWVKQANGVLTKTQFTETTRGRILDIHGQEMAIDVPCTDACVDYRAITTPPDPKWVEGLALARLKALPDAEFKNLSAVQKKERLAKEVAAVNADIVSMWDMLARLYVPVNDDGTAGAQSSVQQIRDGIVKGIEIRRRWLWFRQLQRDKDKETETAKWVKWLAGTSESGPDVEHFTVTLTEMEQPHVILHDISPEAQNFIGVRLEQCPGLTLRPSTRRAYPMKTVACHFLGSLHHVTEADLEPGRAALLDEGRRYLPSDLTGRDGIEAYAEPLLRGSRGKIEKQLGTDTVVSSVDFTPGRDVRLSIDSQLQDQCQQMLQHVVETDPQSHQLLTPPGGVSMHGAIVVIDVKTGEVRALASNPGFDLNALETHYATLMADNDNQPLRDRATSDAIEPGSTVKPMLGLSAITQGVIQPTEGIECTGYLYLPVIAPDGTRTKRLIKMPRGQCWVQSEFAHKGETLAHHIVPTNYPHKGIDGNPDGWLTFSDAIERSCDIYFETVADRMGPDDLCKWYGKFGFGRTTGIGVHEVPGLLENQVPAKSLIDPRMTNCYAGMGQDHTLATPLQIANEAATIARGGVWLRPRLLSTEDQAALDTLRGRDTSNDRVDLQLDKAALEQAKIGMRNVVDGAGGTGHLTKYFPNRPAWLTIAGKTGTADTHPEKVETKDANGIVTSSYRIPAIGGQAETATPWYRSAKGNDLVHGWYMGYAPADDPQIAFAVVIEYAGAGGGVAAAPVAVHVLEACVKDGYLRAPSASATTEGS
jgi:penicillin-binding protein 2